MYSTNPFLQMLAAIGDDEDPLHQPGGSGGPQQQQQPRQGKVQLGDFWPQAPNAWFAAAELKFEVANITPERERFAHAVRHYGLQRPAGCDGPGGESAGGQPLHHFEGPPGPGKRHMALWKHETWPFAWPNDLLSGPLTL